MSDQPRFHVARTLGGARYIEDRSDHSMVAMVLRGDRSEERTAAMLKVMVDALNAAVSRRHTQQPPNQGDRQ